MDSLVRFSETNQAKTFKFNLTSYKRTEPPINKAT